MNKREFATLIDALRFNTRILNKKLGEQELIFNSILELQETIDGQLSTLEEELEKRNLLDEDECIELNDESKRELRVGDYISRPDTNGSCSLFQILETEDKQFYKLDVGKTVIVGEKYNSIDELIDSLVNEDNKQYYDDLYFYYIKDIPEHIVEGRYLIYDEASGEGDYEVIVNYNEDEGVYEILGAGGDTYFYEDTFDCLEELELKLRRDYSLIKSLRYSVQW